MNRIRPVPDHPELGNIYPGDYYPDIPFEAYLNRETQIPEGMHVFDIRKFGAEADGCLNTEALQAAADACGRAGGGVLLVSGGRYLTGTISLPPRTTLFIARDAALAGSPRLADYPPRSDGSRCLIFAEDGDGITITGGGTVEGCGEWFVREPAEKPLLAPIAVTKLPRMDQADEINTVPGTLRTAYRRRIRYTDDRYGGGLPGIERPDHLVHLKGCTGVTVENILLADAPAWTLNLDCCEGAVIRNLVINDNRHVANTDGIDINGSSNVTVEHCFISCADDGLVLKTPPRAKAIRNVRVRDCFVCTVMNAFKIGTETDHDISNVTVENCRFEMPDLSPGSVSGISVMTCEGAKINDICVKNIAMRRVCCPIYLCLDRRSRTGAPYADDPSSTKWWGGEIRNITIEHITAEEAEVPCILTGFVDKNRRGEVIRKAPRGIILRDLSLRWRQNPQELQVPEVMPEFLTGYPESNAHGDVPASALWARHIDSLCLAQFEAVPRFPDPRPAIVTEDCTVCT